MTPKLAVGTDNLDSGSAVDRKWMSQALKLAWRGYGCTSPNPMVGAVIVNKGRVIGQGWHRKAGLAHAEIEALQDAANRQESVVGATLYVSMEPCCTHGRTPACTDAILRARIQRVIVAAIDPNPRHRGRGLRILRHAGLMVQHGVMAEEAARLNESFNHWIVHRTPFVTVKAAMTLDGKIATASGDSKWITEEPARAFAMTLRQGADAIVVGVNTVLADNPRLTVRSSGSSVVHKPKPTLRRIVLDSRARTPLTSRVISDDQAQYPTTIVVGRAAPAKRVARLSRRVAVWRAPLRGGRIDLRWLLKRLGREGVTQVLVEGGGEVNASFLMGKHADRVAFFYAPKILGGRTSLRAVGGVGARQRRGVTTLQAVQWQRFGVDLFLTGLIGPESAEC